MKKELLPILTPLFLFAFSGNSFAQDGMRVGSNSAPLEVLHVDGAILLGNTTNNNLGTIRWNGTEFEGRTASGWVSLSSSSYTHPTQVAIDADAVNNGINVIDRIQVNTLGHVTSVTARDLSNATTAAAGVMSAADKTKLDGIATGATANAGTVTTVSVTSANGVSGTVANPTSTPAISLSLGAITPTSVAASGTVAGSNLSGTNTGDQTITLTSDVTGSGTGSFATTIANDAVTNAKLNNMATSTIKGRTTAGTGDPEDLTPAQVTTMLGLDDAITGTGTANKVAFWTGTNTLDDDIDLHWVSATNRLGIGEDAPDFGLHVTGTGTNQGPGSNDNVIARFEQPTTSSGMGIQLVGYRAQAQTSSFVDFKNYSADVTAEYKLGRVAGVNEDDNFKGALGFSTNPGTTVESLTEQMRITSTGVVRLNAYTTNGIVRTTGGNGTLSTTGGGVNLASEVTGVLPIANGGTGSATQNFVDLTTAQTAAGVKTWSNNAIFNGLVGIGTSVFPAVSRLTLAGFTGTEGGEIQLNGGSSYTNNAFVMDNFEGRFRLIKGTNTAGSGAGSTELLSFKGTNQLGIGNIGGNAWPSESNLIIGANGGVEGGQIQFYNASGAGTAWFLDVENNDFRFLTGNNITGSSGLALAISNSGDFTAAGSIRSNNGRFYGQTGCDNYLSLQSDGNMVLYNSVGGALWNTSTSCSDIRTKTDIVPMESVLPGLLDLSVIRFNYKKELNISDAPQIGVIAQEIQAKYPEMIYHNEETDRYLVQYEKLTALLLKGMQEQQDMIEKLQQENVSVTTNYASLKSDMEAVKDLLRVDMQSSK